MTKEVICTARNLMIVPDGDPHTEAAAVRPMVEAILVVSEPVFGFDAGGELGRKRETQTIRFSASPEVLRKLAKNYLEWADEAEEFAKALSLKKESEAQE